VGVGLDHIPRSLTYPNKQRLRRKICWRRCSLIGRCALRRTTLTVSHSSGRLMYALTAFVASQESLTQPCFFPSDLGDQFLGEAFASCGYFGLSAPITLKSVISKPDTTVPTGQLSSNSTDGTESFDMLDPWQAQMDAASVDDVMRRCALSVSDRASCTPSLGGSDRSYSHTTESAAFTPNQESLHSSPSVTSVLPRKPPRDPTGPTYTCGSLSASTPDNCERIAHRAPKLVPYNKVKRKHPCTSSDEEDTSQIRAKQAHSAVERRYRENLNSKIMDLHQTLVTTEFSSRFSEGADMKPWDSKKEGWSKIRKSDILVDAMNYVHQSEIEMRHMSDEIRQSRERIRMLEKLVNVRTGQY
jgi:hypothetical protein